MTSYKVESYNIPSHFQKKEPKLRDVVTSGRELVGPYRPPPDPEHSLPTRVLLPAPQPPGVQTRAPFLQIPRSWPQVATSALAYELKNPKVWGIWGSLLVANRVLCFKPNYLPRFLTIKSFPMKICIYGFLGGGEHI